MLVWRPQSAPSQGGFQMANVAPTNETPRKQWYVSGKVVTIQQYFVDKVTLFIEKGTKHRVLSEDSLLWLESIKANASW